MSIYQIDTRYRKGDDRNVQKTVALELALGCSLPDCIAEWPAGLLAQWNDAAEARAFDATKTIGDMARAFLAYRIADFGAK